MAIAESLRQAVALSNEKDKELARLIGGHIDRQTAILDTPIEPLSSQPALAPSKSSDFAQMRDVELRSLLTAYNIKGRGRKGLKRADRVVLLVKNNVPALTFGFLLDFYLQSTR